MWFSFHMLPLLLSNWLVEITWTPSSVSAHSHWMVKVTWNSSSFIIHSYLTDWNHMTGSISQCMFLLDDKRSHEWPWMPCVGTWIPIGCWKSNECFLWELVFWLVSLLQPYSYINIRWLVMSWWCYLVMSCCIIYLLLSSSVCMW